MTIPTDIPNVLAWHKADTGVFKDAGVTPATLNGDAIQQWNDQGPLGNNLTQATAGNRPTLNTTTVNGHNVVGFAAASSQFFSYPTGMFTGVTEAEVFVVFKMTAYPPTVSSKTGLWHLGNSGSDTNLWTDSQFYETFGSNTRAAAFTPAFNPATTYRIYNVWSTGVKNSGYRQWAALQNYVIGQQMAYGAFSVSFPSTGLLGKSSGGAAFFDGTIAEILIYSRRLTDEERSAIADYLGITRYALYSTGGNVRETQVSVEAAQQTNPNLRMTQVAVEANIIPPGTQQLRVTQLGVETVLVPAGTQAARLTQIAIEALKTSVQDSSPQGTDASAGWTPFTGVALPPMVDHDDDSKYMYSSLGAQGDSATFSMGAVLPTSTPSGVRIQIRMNWE